MAINPLLLNVKPISEITTVDNPTEGHLLFYDGSDELKKVDIVEFQSLIGGIAKPLAISDASPTVSGWYKPTTVGTYANAGGLVAQVGYDTLFYFDGTTWSLIATDLPQPIVNNYTNNNTYNLDPEQIVPSEALYTDDTLAGDIIKRVDINTGENVNYRETTTWFDGSPMDDTKVDGVNYRKIGNKFYKRAGVRGQEINILHLGAKSEPNFDNTAILQLAVDNYKNVFIPEGVFEFTRFKITKEGVRLYGLGAGISVLSSTNVFQSGVHVPPNIRILNHNCTIEGITSTFTNLPDWKVTATGQSPINSDANLSIGWSEAYAPSNTFLIKNVIIKNCEVIGSFVQGIAIGVSENVKILNNKVSQIRGTAIFGYYASKITVEGNEVWFTGDDGIYMAGNGTSIYSPHAMNENVLIQNNYVHDVCTKGIGVSGCSSAIIKNNVINNTWVDGIMAEQDTIGGHVTPKNVKILNNVLTNLFGAFGGVYKHSQNANVTTGGLYGGIKTFNKDNDSSVYEISGNYIEVSEKVLSTGGLYNAVILGFNTNFINNTLPNTSSINMWVGQMYAQTGSENILIKGNNIKSNYRNILLVKTKKTKIVNNNFYAPDWGILTDQTEDVKVIGNTGHINTIFFLNQTSDPGVVLQNNFFDIND